MLIPKTASLTVFFSDFFQEIGSVHQYNTRASNNRNYNTISCRSSRGQKSIKYYGPKIWNDIPNSCRDLPKIAFKKQFKNIIFSKYWTRLFTDSSKYKVIVPLCLLTCQWFLTHSFQYYIFYYLLVTVYITMLNSTCHLTPFFVHVSLATCLGVRG